MAPVKAKGLTREVMERLRLLIFATKITQAEIERRVGFSRGYLSQLLNGAVDMKLHHLLEIADAMGIEAGDFFAALFPRSRPAIFDALDDFRRSSRRENPVSLELARLYGYGIETIEDLRRRLQRCEDALQDLRQLGVL